MTTRTTIPQAIGGAGQSAAQTPRARRAGALTAGLFNYILATSWRHQLVLVLLSVIGFLLEIVPLELQRRAIDDLVGRQSFHWIIMIALAYAAVVLVEGGSKLGVDV